MFALLTLATILTYKAQDVPITIKTPSEAIIREIPPILASIGKCESQLQQFNPDGSVLHGKKHPADIGMFQINSAVWGVKAKELGFDLNTIEGNKDMALYIFNLKGTQPWYSSESCWA